MDLKEIFSGDSLARLFQSPEVVSSPGEIPANVPDSAQKEASAAPGVRVLETPGPLYKSQPVRVFNNQSISATSDERVDCRNWNAVHVEVRVTGTTPSATLEIQGADETRNWLTLPAAKATQTITQDTNFDVAVPTLLATAKLTITAGTYTVTLTPFIAGQIEGASGETVLLTSAARTTQQTTGDQNAGNARGIQVILDVTASAAGTGGLTVQIQGKDPASGKYYQLNANPTAVTGTGTKIYELYPGIGAATGDITQRTSASLPKTWRINVAVGDATSYTYSLGAVAIL